MACLRDRQVAVKQTFVGDGFVSGAEGRHSLRKGKSKYLAVDTSTWINQTYPSPHQPDTSGELCADCLNDTLPDIKCMKTYVCNYVIHCCWQNSIYCGRFALTEFNDKQSVTHRDGAERRTRQNLRALFDHAYQVAFPLLDLKQGGSSHFLRIVLHETFPYLHQQDIAILSVSVERVFRERSKSASQ